MIFKLSTVPFIFPPTLLISNYPSHISFLQNNYPLVSFQDSPISMCRNQHPTKTSDVYLKPRSNNNHVSTFNLNLIGPITREQSSSDFSYVDHQVSFISYEILYKHRI